MKKLLWLLAIVVVATAARDVILYFGPLAEAYRSYREQAQATAYERAEEKPFDSIDGFLVDTAYRLESSQPAGKDQVSLVVVESFHFQKMSETGPFGNRRIARTRQRILMSKVHGRWTISKLEQDSPEIEELAHIADELD